MNLRKFYFTLSIIISVFLFISGTVFMFFMQNNSLDADIINADSNLFKPYMIGKDSFNVLLLGGDKVNSNSDTIMLLNFNPKTYKINIMSIPRDTKVYIDKSYHKINYAYPHGGIDLTVKTVSELLDVNIKYYVYVDTAAFRKIIDLLDGIDINVPPGMDYDDPTQDLHIHLKEGLQHLNGEQAEQFVRFRNPNKWTKELKNYYDGSDLKRIEAQHIFIQELIRQKLNIQYITKLNSIINVTFDNIETNFTMNDLLKLATWASKLNAESFQFISLPGTPYDSSPWYYLCDVSASREITAQNFIGSESFVKIEDELKDLYDKNSDEISKSSTSDKSNNKSYTKNNPSNSDSSFSGTQQPAP